MVALKTYKLLCQNDDVMSDIVSKTILLFSDNNQNSKVGSLDSGQIEDSGQLVS